MSVQIYYVNPPQRCNWFQSQFSNVKRFVIDMDNYYVLYIDNTQIGFVIGFAEPHGDFFSYAGFRIFFPPTISNYVYIITLMSRKKTVFFINSFCRGEFFFFFFVNSYSTTNQYFILHFSTRFSPFYSSVLLRVLLTFFLYKIYYASTYRE